ncbi:MAG: hypothetical protein AAFR16_11165 [Pseudomonadota bacterium]
MPLYKLSKRRGAAAADARALAREARPTVEDAERAARRARAEAAFAAARRAPMGEAVFASVLLPITVSPAVRDALYCDPLDAYLSEREAGRIVGVGAARALDDDADPDAVLAEDDEDEAVDGVVIIDLELADGAGGAVAVLEAFHAIGAPAGATLELHHADELEEIPLVGLQ